MKRLVITPTGSEEVDLTAEEISDFELRKEQSIINKEKREKDKETLQNLKSSAKTKLMNGEALTEDEANVMVGL